MRSLVSRRSPIRAGRPLKSAARPADHPGAAVSYQDVLSRIGAIQARALALRGSGAGVVASPQALATSQSAPAAISTSSFAQALQAATAGQESAASAAATPPVAAATPPAAVPAEISATPADPAPPPTAPGATVVSTTQATSAAPVASAAPAAPVVPVASAAPAAPDSAAAPASYAYPLGARGEVIGLPYQGSHTLYDNWESDNALDIATPVGTPVYAVADGTIGDQIGSLGSSDPHLDGLRLHLVTSDNEFYYAHLSQLVVQAGQHVAKGQLLGYSGEANGVAHLHFAAENGSPVDVVSP